MASRPVVAVFPFNFISFQIRSVFVSVLFVPFMTVNLPSSSDLGPGVLSGLRFEYGPRHHLLPLSISGEVGTGYQ